MYITVSESTLILTWLYFNTSTMRVQTTDKITLWKMRYLGMLKNPSIVVMTYLFIVS